MPIYATSLREVLNSFDDEDAAAVFAAIRLANPGGLGSVPEQDVADAPTVGLLEAMHLAAEPRSHRRRLRDRLRRDLRVRVAGASQCARAYGRSEPRRHHAAHGLSCRYFPTVTLSASTVLPPRRRCARRRAHCVHLGNLWRSRNTLAKLLDFDAELKRRNVNPGTTADLVVATAFCRLHVRRNGPSGRPLSPLSPKGALRYLVAVLKARRYPANRFGDIVAGRR